MIGIIGASGFVGQALSKLFADEGTEYRGFDKRPGYGDANVVLFDLMQSPANKQFTGCTCLINLAAEHRDDVKPVARYYEVNVEGARRACEIADQNNIHQIVFTSSVAVYGFAPNNTGEDGVHEYFNEYGRTKHLAEKVYVEWQSKRPQERSVIIVRPTVIFGPGNRGNVYNLLQQIASRKFVMFGGGRNVKSMAFVDNVAKFLAHCTSFGSGVHVYNYVDKPDLDMNSLVCTAREHLFNSPNVGIRLPGFFGLMIGWGFDALALLTRKNFRVSSIRVKKFMATTQFNSAVSKTDFKAPYTLVEGLEKTLRYEFLEDNRDKATYDTE